MKNGLASCAITLILLLSLAGCSTFTSIPSQVTVTPTPTQSPSCPFVSNPGPPPPEVEKLAEENFYNLQVKGLPGSLKVYAYGDYSCDQFSVRDINFEYVIGVNDLEDQTAMRDIVATLEDSAKNSLLGWNMGVVRIRFVSGKECWWDELQNACSSIRPLTVP